MMRTQPCAGVGASVMRPEMTAASDIDRLSDHREIDVKSGALLRRAFDANLSRMLLNNSVGHREPEPGAAFLPIAYGALGGEERTVNAVNMFLRDSRSTVRNRDTDAVSIGGYNPQRAPVRHCVFGVEEKIQEDLLQASGIALDWRQVGCKLILHSNPASLELVLKQAQCVEDNPVHIDFGEFRAAGTGEVQQIIDDL